METKKKTVMVTAGSKLSRGSLELSFTTISW